MIIPSRMDAVRALVDGTFTFKSDGTIVYHDGQIAPSESAINAKLAELQAAEPIRLLRVDRNQLLVESDWTGLADSAITPEVSAKWKLYRQRLRDLPSGLDTESKVKNVKWPTAPG